MPIGPLECSPQPVVSGAGLMRPDHLIPLGHMLISARSLTNDGRVCGAAADIFISQRQTGDRNIARLVAGCGGTPSVLSHGRTGGRFSAHSHERIGRGSDEDNFPE